MMSYYRRIVFFLLSGLLLSGNGQAQATSVAGVDFSVLIERVDSLRGKKAIFRDTISPLLGVASLGFWEFASVDLRLTSLDSVAVEFDFQIVVSGGSNHTMSKQYRAAYGLPVRIRNLMVNGYGSKNRYYDLTLVPLVRFEQDTAGCSYAIERTDQMEIHPTATFRLSAPKGTLAALSLNSLGDQFEQGLEYYKRLVTYHSSFQGNITLLPCASPALLWPRDDLALVDPGRGTIWMQYGIERNVFDHTSVNRLMVLRHEGYIPHPVLQGLVRFDSADEWKTVKRHRAGESVTDLQPWLENWTADSSPLKSEAGAAFLRYLILRSGVDSFRVFARAAEEFDLSGQLAGYYQRSIRELLSSWAGYLDTVSFQPQQLTLFSDRAAVGFRFEEAAELQLTTLPMSRTAQDTQLVLSKLTSLRFANGDYARAAEYEFRRDSLSQAAAGFALMAGDTSRSAAVYRRLIEKNARDNGARFGLAQWYLANGKLPDAFPLLKSITEYPQSSMAQAESRALLGWYLPRIKGKRSAEADTFLVDAQRWYDAILKGPQASPSHSIWYGLTLAAQGELAAAQERLQIGLFLEVRPFYRGMALLWLGKIADLKNERSRAREYYTEVVAMKAAAYHRREAEHYLKTPFKL